MGGVKERDLRAVLASDVRIEIPGLPPITSADEYVHLLLTGPGLIKCPPTRFIQKVYAGNQGSFLYECETPAGPVPFSETLTVSAGKVTLSRALADLSAVPAAAANTGLVDAIRPAVFTTHDVHGYERMLADTFTIHTAGQDLDRAGFEGLVSTAFAAFPDFDEHMHVLEANATGAVAVAYITGTHTGASFLGVPASGKKVGFTTVHAFRMQGGKIVEDWAEADFASARTQITTSAVAPTMTEMEAAFDRANAEADKDCAAAVSDPVSTATWDQWKKVVPTGDSAGTDALYSPHFRLQFADTLEGTATDAKNRVAFVHSLGSIVSLDDLTPRYVGNRYLAGGGKVIFDYLNPHGVAGLPVLPDAKRVSFGETHVIRVCGGHVVRQFSNLDLLGFFAQVTPH
jgi:predicted ester cyclase